MDSAKDKYTGQIVDGEQLWYIEEVDKEGYICRGCGVPMNPVSFARGLKTRPHFREFEKHPHKEWCKIEGEIELIKKAKKQRVTTPQGFPASFPYKLELIEQRVKVDTSEDDEGGNSFPIRGTSKSSGGGSSTVTSKWIARTIRPICRTYYNFPKDRDLPLVITGTYGETYNDVIRRLSSQEIVQYTKQHLFYAPIGWQEIEMHDGYFVINSSYGYWVNKKLNPYKVQVNTEDWSQSKINYVLEELNVARHDAIDIKKKDQKTKIKSWLFFIGEQSLKNPNIFIVNDHRLICCLTLNI